jgi:3-methylfumaryl-CoA hydratase
MAVHPTAIQLFRYSALTFNSHRIHFDHEYAKNVEDHPGKWILNSLFSPFCYFTD